VMWAWVVWAVLEVGVVGCAGAARAAAVRLGGAEMDPEGWFEAADDAIHSGRLEIAIDGKP